MKGSKQGEIQALLDIYIDPQYLAFGLCLQFIMRCRGLVVVVSASEALVLLLRLWLLLWVDDSIVPRQENTR